MKTSIKLPEMNGQRSPYICTKKPTPIQYNVNKALRPPPQKKRHRSVKLEKELNINCVGHTQQISFYE